MVDGEREAARLGLRGSFGHFMYVNGADDLLRLGRWDEAAERVREAARMDLSRTAGALRRAIVGQLARGSRRVRAAARERSTPPPTTSLPAEFLAPLAAARAALALAEDDPVAAAVHVAGALGGVEDPFYTAAALLARAAGRGRARRARAGAPPRARPRRARDALLDAARRRCARCRPTRSRSSRSPAPSSRASTATPAPERWLEAAAAFDALGEPYPAAYARLHAAEATLLAGGERGRRRARRSPPPAPRCDALGAVPLRDAADALARRARLDVARPTRPRVEPDDDGAGLTDPRDRGPAGCSPTA